MVLGASCGMRKSCGLVPSRLPAYHLPCKSNLLLLLSILLLYVFLPCMKLEDQEVTLMCYQSNMINLILRYYVSRQDLTVKINSPTSLGPDAVMVQYSLSYKH